MSSRTRLAVFCALTIMTTAPSFAEQVVWEEKGIIYEEVTAPSIEVGEVNKEVNKIIAKATTAESVYVAATVSNTLTTGHGNVQFKVLWNTSTNAWQILAWSYNSPYGCVGYRQWYQQPVGTFGSWPRSGGAACVGWPPDITGMNKSMQLIDIDGDGDLDVFQLVETSSQNWVVYLYKNSN